MAGKNKTHIEAAIIIVLMKIIDLCWDEKHLRRSTGSIPRAPLL